MQRVVFWDQHHLNSHKIYQTLSSVICPISHRWPECFQWSPIKEQLHTAVPRHIISNDCGQEDQFISTLDVLRNEVPSAAAESLRHQPGNSSHLSCAPQKVNTQCCNQSRSDFYWIKRCEVQHREEKEAAASCHCGRIPPRHSGTEGLSPFTPSSV